MTTIAFKDGVLCADSCETSGCEDSGTLAATCDKLFRVGQFVVALQGDTTPGMIWLHWFRQWECKVRTLGDKVLPIVPTEFVDRWLEREADFTAVVRCPTGELCIYDEWGHPQEVTAPYYAVGSGAKVALGAMHAGASAFEAVMAACAHDPYTSAPVHSSEKT